jgi:hypothetical protein
MNTFAVAQPEERKGLKIHGIVTLCVAALLTVINFAVCPEFLWFFFPLAGMSIGLIVHYLGARSAK